MVRIVWFWPRSNQCQRVPGRISGVAQPEPGVHCTDEGYGLSVTPLQLVQAYAVLAAGGLQRPVSLLAVNQPPIARRVVRKNTADALMAMLELVVSPNGTGQRAAVSGYRVAGKTGTTRKFAGGGYSEDRYTAVFAGVVPASNPRLAAVIVIDEPGTGEYYGGHVAAPVFAQVMAGALRILAIPPDQVDELRDGSVTVAANRK